MPERQTLHELQQSRDRPPSLFTIDGKNPGNGPSSRHDREALPLGYLPKQF